MVMTLRERVPSIAPQIESDSETPPKKKKTQKNSKPIKRRETFSSSESEFNSDSEKENESSFEYEKIREQRIRENRERMEKLGIFTLSSQVFNGNQKVGRRKNPPQKKKRYPPLYPRVRDRSYDYARRSSRLKDMETERSLKEMGISIPEEWTIEVYTEEDEKLLGDCETIWTLEADSLDEDGDRVYDLERPPCHQCRQRRAGKFTYCSKCRAPQGQICGECLYTRYGENVLEARQNPTWSCPACRGICNCSRCRRTKGWDPINIPHSKVIESGFNSVAHYLILTRRAGATPKELNDGAEVVDLTAEEIAVAPHDEGSDYSAEWSGAESDDSDSEDETKGDKNNEEQPDKNDEEQLDENQVASAAKSIEAADSEDETKGEKNKEEQPDKNDEEQLDENQVASAEKSIEAAVATDRDEVL